MILAGTKETGEASTEEFVDPFQIDVMPALLRAAKRAREIARQTNTPLVIVRDGMLVHEMADGRVVKSVPLKKSA